MRIYYSGSAKRENVSYDSPIEASGADLMAVFVNLAPGRGFLNVEVTAHVMLQLLMNKKDVSVELLDTTAKTMEVTRAQAVDVQKVLEKLCEQGCSPEEIRSEFKQWMKIDLSNPEEGGAQTQNAKAEGSSIGVGEKFNSTPQTIRFHATEAGFKDGLGGASNSKGKEAYHYILFGAQTDPQHAWNSGMYFEYDSQANGGVNHVESVESEENRVCFLMKNGTRIEVVCGVEADSWTLFTDSVKRNFPLA